MIQFDVVIVNWNAGPYLKECLESLLLFRQDLSSQLSQCIVVDNASQDGSLEGVENIPLPTILVRNSTNRGLGSAANQGARRGAAEYILFLNPDIQLSPNSLPEALDFLENPLNGQIGILGIQLVDHAGVVQRNAARFPTPASFIQQMLGLDRLFPSRFPPRIMSDWDHRANREVDAVQGAFFLVRREVFEDVGGFDENFFLYFEEVDFARRARQAGWRCFYLAETQARHYGGGTTEGIKARRLFYWLRSRAQYTGKHFGRSSFYMVLIASFLIEFWTRTAWNLINFSWDHLLETFQAYIMYGAVVPQLVQESYGKDQRPAGS
jgi:N-acetylglucosaminyl-diphospho-decaprenol L-rhamnosyltransferase